MQDLTESREAPMPVTTFKRFAHRYPAIVHAGVVSAFVVPLALIPYLLARRQINGLRQSITQLERKATVFQRALDLATDSSNVTKGEMRRLHDLTRNSIEATAALRKEIGHQKADRRKVDEKVNTNIRMVLAQSQHHMRPTLANLQELGTSLADVAAFMEEVELDLGMTRNPTDAEDQLGINRLRILALRMQSIHHDYKDDAVSDLDK